nr:hypothetical protein [Tanacetum cinerariifolium]
MSNMGCCLTQDTSVMRLESFAVGEKWRMLFLNEMLDKAYKYHMEMKEKGVLPDPETEKRMEAWMAGVKDS